MLEKGIGIIDPLTVNVDGDFCQMSRPIFYTYMLTNRSKTVLYTDFTNSLGIRLIEHWIRKARKFTTKYKTHFLVWYEETKYVLNAIAREKEIKHYTRAQKEALINAFNPEWKFLNEDILGNWPPTKAQIAAAKERWGSNDKGLNL